MEDDKTIASCSYDHLEPSLKDLILKPKSNRICRPPNAFMLFARDYRRSLASQHPDVSNKAISTMLGEMWRRADKRTKDQYFDRSKMLEVLHKNQYPGYVYSPREARLQKKNRTKRRGNPNSESRETLGDAKVLKQLKREKKFSPKGNTPDATCSTPVTNDFERKTSSPEYVPNNPQFFTKPNNMMNNSEVSVQPNQRYCGWPPLQRYSVPQGPRPFFCDRQHAAIDTDSSFYPDMCCSRQMRSNRCGCNCGARIQPGSPVPPEPNWNTYPTGCRNNCSVHGFDAGDPSLPGPNCIELRTPLPRFQHRATPAPRCGSGFVPLNRPNLPSKQPSSSYLPRPWMYWRPDHMPNISQNAEQQHVHYEDYNVCPTTSSSYPPEQPQYSIDYTNRTVVKEEKISSPCPSPSQENSSQQSLISPSEPINGDNSSCITYNNVDADMSETEKDRLMAQINNDHLYI